MVECMNIFNVKRALAVHTVFFSFALLQKEFNLGLLWFILNTVVLMLLLQTVYKENNNWALISWYFYVLSFFTDLLSIASFGHDLSKGENTSEKKSAQRFILSMAICLMLVKPIFAIFIGKKLKADGIELKSGLRNPKESLASLDYKDINQGTYDGPQISNNYNNNNNNNNMVQEQVIEEPPPNYVDTFNVPLNDDNNTNVTGTIGSGPPPNEYSDFTSPGTDNNV